MELRSLINSANCLFRQHRWAAGTRELCNIVPGEFDEDVYGVSREEVLVMLRESIRALDSDTRKGVRKTIKRWFGESIITKSNLGIWLECGPHFVEPDALIFIYDSMGPKWKEAINILPAVSELEVQNWTLWIAGSKISGSAQDLSGATSDAYELARIYGLEVKIGGISNEDITGRC